MEYPSGLARAISPLDIVDFRLLWPTKTSLLSGSHCTRYNDWEVETRETKNETDSFFIRRYDKLGGTEELTARLVRRRDAHLVILGTTTYEHL